MWERGPSRPLDTSFGNFLAESLVSLLNAKTEFREVDEEGENTAFLPRYKGAVLVIRSV
jgi:hypothetical protein